MRYVYLKNGDAVDQVRRIGASAERPGGPDAFIADFVRAHADDQLLILSRWSADEFSSGNIQARSFGPSRGLFARTGAAVKIGAAMMRFRPDRIVCGCSAELLWVSLIVARLLGVPIVNSRHTGLVRHRYIGRLSGALDRLSIRACDGVACHGTYLLEQMRSLGVRVSPTHEFDVDYAEFAASASRATPPRALQVFAKQFGIIFMFVGRVQRDKGALDLLAAFAALSPDAAANAGLVYVGDGKDMQTLVREVGHQGLARRVLILGKCPHAQLPAVMSNASAVVTPTQATLQEGRCMVVSESLALGVPVVAPDFGPFPFGVRRDVDGLLYEPGDRQALTECLSRIVLDEDLRSRLRRGAAQSAAALVRSHNSFARAVDAAFRVSL
jgi:glycosyltransferase involved in cell wall biosynthesis